MVWSWFGQKNFWGLWGGLPVIGIYCMKLFLLYESNKQSLQKFIVYLERVRGGVLSKMSLFKISKGFYSQTLRQVTYWISGIHRVSHSLHIRRYKNANSSKESCIRWNPWVSLLLRVQEDYLLSFSLQGT